MDVELAAADLFHVLVDVELLLLLLGQVGLLDRPESLVFVDVRLVLPTQGNEEVVQEVVSDLLPLVFDDVVLCLLLLSLLFVNDWSVLLLVVLFQLFYLIGIQYVSGAVTEYNFVKLGHVLNFVDQFTMDVVEVDTLGRSVKALQS